MKLTVHRVKQYNSTYKHVISLNGQRIANRELINRREKLNAEAYDKASEAYNQASEKFRKTFAESIEKHKGNLSKATAIEIAGLSVKEKAVD